MKFAIDVDGVIGEQPEFFAVLTKALRAAGHFVYIVTDFDEHFRDQRVAELQEYGVEYDELVITAQKQEFCRSNGVDFAIDDDAREYFPSCEGPFVGIVKIPRDAP